ncbi:MAG TPA: carbohydrate binding family 9 domain-containing protein, partial [Longimicrobiales bacterium]|nr:carbohydrate binding family 9 domain-containing protein [Longimicrobiales bacterium]
MTRLVLPCVLLFTAGSVQAQTAPMELARLQGAISLDGVMDDEAWQRILPLPLTMYLPVAGGEPTQRTEIRVAYDDEHLYVGGWFYDDDSSGIRINSLYRDRWNGDDALAICIDAFNDNRNAKWFGTTPGGIRFDILLSDDGNTQNPSWDTFWDSRVTVTGEGWFAEVRIPFSSLGFVVDDAQRAVMGLTVTRLVSRSAERVTFPAIDPSVEFRRPSAAQDVVLRDVRTRRPLHVTPYAMTGRADHAVAAVPTGFRREHDTSTEVGLDVRFPLSSQLSLDLSVNTDFAQAEADDQQVQLDRSPLFFPKRRRFFQEGGARLVGRVGDWDVGLLDMQTQAAHGLPAENAGVLRLRRGILNPWSTAGLPHMRQDPSGT